MKLPVYFCLLLIGMSGGLHAQTLRNTSWKAFIADPLHDSITIHITTDSSFVTTSDGSVIVKSVFKVSGDTLTLSDYDGQHACPDATGRYKVAVADDMLTFALIDDPCEGRTGALTHAKWRRLPEK